MVTLPLCSSLPEVCTQDAREINIRLGRVALTLWTCLRVGTRSMGEMRASKRCRYYSLTHANGHGARTILDCKHSKLDGTSRRCRRLFRNFRCLAHPVRLLDSLTARLCFAAPVLHRSSVFCSRGSPTGQFLSSSEAVADILERQKSASR